MRSVSQKSWSRLQCWAVDHEAYDQLDKSFNNPEGPENGDVSKTHRESVRDAPQLQKEDPSVAGTAWC